MRTKQEEEPNFIEKRRVWKSKLDKPIGPNLLLTMLPALVMCLFLVLAAPYLRLFAMKLLSKKQEIEIRSIEVGEEPVRKIVLPPPNAEEAIREINRKQLEREGIDWRNGPVLELPLEEPVEKEIVIRPIEVIYDLSDHSHEIDSAIPEASPE